MPNLSLNHDVLDQILRACATDSLATISLVSSYFRILALPHLLRFVSLDRDPEQLISFLDFMIKPENKNLQVFNSGIYVNKLEIGLFALLAIRNFGNSGSEFAPYPKFPASAWAPTLTRALSLMPNLQSFVIEGLIEEIAIHSPDFAITLLTRPHLTHIDLSYLGPVASTCFGEAMTSKNVAMLEIVSLNRNDDIEDPQLVAHKGIASFLFHSGKHLTQIDFCSYNLGNLLRKYRFKDDTHNIETLAIFPNVLKLSAKNCDILLKSFAIAFPALRTLMLHVPSFSESEKSGDGVISFPNLLSIKGQPRDVRSFFNSISGSIHVRRIDLNYGHSDWDAIYEDGATTEFALTRSAPFLRSLHFSHRENTSISWWKALANTIPHLTYLSISPSPDSTDELAFLFTQPPLCLASVPLIYISLNVRGLGHVIGDHASPGIQAMVTEEAIAMSYGRSILTLKYVDVHKEINHVKGVIKWWSVVRGSSLSNVDVRLKVLDAEEGMALRKWYDLEFWK